MEYFIRNRLLTVLNQAYPEQYNELNHFYVACQPKESISHCYKYYYPMRKIMVNSFSRNPADIFIDYLQGLATHIDIVFRKETHMDRTYFLVLKKLLDTSIKLNLITLHMVQNCSNKKLVNNLQKNFGAINNWSIKILDIPPMDIYVYVDNAIFIKNVLKHSDYHYSADQMLWIKAIKPIDYDDESYFIESNKDKAEFKIIGDNSFWIRPCYKLKLETYDKSSAPLLSALSYRYDSKANRWWKIIHSSDYKIEIEMISKIPKQRYNLSFLDNH